MPEALVIQNPLHLLQLQHHRAHESEGPWSCSFINSSLDPSLISVQIPGDCATMSSQHLGLCLWVCWKYVVRMKSPLEIITAWLSSSGFLPPVCAGRHPAAGTFTGLHGCCLLSTFALFPLPDMHLLTFPTCRFPSFPMKGLSPPCSILLNNNSNNPLCV